MGGTSTTTTVANWANRTDIIFATTRKTGTTTCRATNNQQLLRIDGSVSRHAQRIVDDWEGRR